MAKAKEGIGWQTATIDIDRDTEFAGDDVDRYSSVIDLGRECSGVVIKLPAMTSSAISLYAQEVAAIATVPVPVHYRQASDDATTAWITTASTGSLTIHCNWLGAIRYIRIYAAVNQATDRSISVLGTV